MSYNDNFTDDEFKILLDFATWVANDVRVTGNLCAVELLAKYRAWSRGTDHPKQAKDE